MNIKLFLFTINIRKNKKHEKCSFNVWTRLEYCQDVLHKKFQSYFIACV